MEKEFQKSKWEKCECTHFPRLFCVCREKNMRKMNKPEIMWVCFPFLFVFVFSWKKKKQHDIKAPQPCVIDSTPQEIETD